MKDAEKDSVTMLAHAILAQAMEAQGLLIALRVPELISTLEAKLSCSVCSQPFQREKTDCFVRPRGKQCHTVFK